MRRYKNNKNLFSVLSHIFMHDLKYGGHTKTKSPQIEQFIDIVLPDLIQLRLEILNEASGSLHKEDTDIGNCKTASNHHNHVGEILTRSEESKNRDRLAKTGRCINHNYLVSKNKLSLFIFIFFFIKNHKFFFFSQYFFKYKSYS